MSRRDGNRYRNEYDGWWELLAPDDIVTEGDHWAVRDDTALLPVRNGFGLRNTNHPRGGHVYRRCPQVKADAREWACQRPVCKAKATTNEHNHCCWRCGAPAPKEGRP